MVKKVFLVGACFVFVFFFLFSPGSSDGLWLSFGNQSFSLEVADDISSRSVGLMNRSFLCSSCGMFFVFSDSLPRSFWMKDTLISLDIVFLDEDFVIVNVSKANPCLENPCKSYDSVLPAKFVVEVNQGFFSKDDIGSEIFLLES